MEYFSAFGGSSSSLFNSLASIASSFTLPSCTHTSHTHTEINAHNIYRHTIHQMHAFMRCTLLAGTDSVRERDARKWLSYHQIRDARVVRTYDAWFQVPRTHTYICMYIYIYLRRRRASHCPARARAKAATTAATTARTAQFVQSGNLICALQ